MDTLPPAVVYERASADYVAGGRMELSIDTWPPVGSDIEVLIEFT